MIVCGRMNNATHGFDFLSDPILIVTLDGSILEMNAAARALFAAQPEHASLASIVADDPVVWTSFLKRSSGSTAPRPGALEFNGMSGPVKFALQAARSKQVGSGVQIILRLIPQTADRFVMLDRRVRDLDAQLHEKLHKNALLEEALRQKHLLLRELQHRVKNNIQLIMSLTQITAKGYDSPEVTAVVATLRGRLQAMAAAQEALYQGDEVDTVMARGFLESVILTAARATGASHAVSLSLDDLELSSTEAHGLALITNELVTNAAKYGLRNGQGHISVTFSEQGGGYRLTVTDDGPGISDEAASRSSGLALVRGLCRQIGGRLEIDGNIGTTCMVHFAPTASERVYSDTRS